MNPKVGGAPAVVYQVERSGALVAMASSGEAGPFRGRFTIPAGVGVCGLAVRNRCPVVTEDLTSDPRIVLTPEIRAALELAPHRAALAVPFVIGERVIGAFLLGDRRGRRFTAEEVRLAQAFADQAAVALENARLYEEANRMRLSEQAARAAAEAANRTKDEFLATLSHELRTPLNAILGWITMLRTGRLDADTAAHGLETVERNTRLQAELIEDLLDVSRIITGKLRLDCRPTDLAGVIEAACDAIRSAIEAKGLQLSVDLDTSTGFVWGDPGRLQQIVWNLLSNAVKFTPRGGHVEVRLESAAGEAVLVVSDTGRGIGPEFLPHVFERFRQAETAPTRSYGGLGLGLAIVRHLVELHGGSVEAASAGEGLGATLTVRLPSMPGLSGLGSSAGAPPVGAEAESFVLAGTSLLVVEDDADTRELLETMLSAFGAEVRTASAASEALEGVRARAPDVLIVDIAMPGEDGYSLIRKLRTFPPASGGTVLAIALTAYAQAEDQHRALASGFQVHLTKPVDPNELITTVARLLKRRGVEDEA